MKTKTALITGASRGLGRALAQVFADNDYRLILHSKEKYISKIERSFRFDRHLTVVPDVVHGDIRDKGTIEKLSKIANEKNLDVLINNAGTYIKKPLRYLTDEEFNEVLGANLMGVIALTKTIWPIFEAKKNGIIININSIAGKKGSDGESIYAASKHGLKGFFDSLDFEAKQKNIRIINVYSGAINTDMTAHRPDKNKLIDSQEAAIAIHSICAEYKTLNISEVTIGRRVY